MNNLIITLPVGEAAQASAIAAVGIIGKKHDVLRPIALRALHSIATCKGSVVQPYLDDLRRGN